jgi:hypothetical protein
MTDEPLAAKKRHGSNKRQRQKITPVRWTMDQFNEVSARAAQAGLSFGAFMRALALQDPGPRSQRVPPVEKELLLRVLGQFGRLNNNVNQIAHNGNAGDPVDLPELRLVMKDYAPLRDAAFEALGKTPTGQALKTWAEIARQASQLLKSNPGAETIEVPADLLRRITRGLAPEAAQESNTDAPKQPSARSQFMPGGSSSGEATGA